jgi:molybdopterin converting factor small subunit
MVTVRVPTQLRSHVGGAATLEVGGESVGEVLRTIGRDHPAFLYTVLNEDGSLHRFVNVYLDDDDVRYIGGLDAKVHVGQTISLIPAVAGG